MNRAQRRSARRDPCALLRAVDRCSPMAPSVSVDVALKLRSAFDSMKSGQGADHDFDALAGAMNVGLIRAEAIAPELVAHMQAGQQALLSADEICGRHGRFGFTGPGLAAMDQALEAYEAIVSASTPAQMAAAAQESARRMRRGHLFRAEEAK